MMATQRPVLLSLICGSLLAGSALLVGSAVAADASKSTTQGEPGEQQVQKSAHATTSLASKAMSDQELDQVSAGNFVSLPFKIGFGPGVAIGIDPGKANFLGVRESFPVKPCSGNLQITC